MGAKSSIALILLVVVGCAAGPGSAAATRGAAAAPQPAAAADESGPVAETAAGVAAPSEIMAEADQAFESQLGASRGQFDVERQVGVLKQAVLLYTQFLERADGRPELEPAVRKSRERIADAKATIEFLEATLKGDGQPPGPPSQ